jgi:hypothetical protein
MVQRIWIDEMTELLRYVVDRAVAANRLPATVEATDPRTGITTTVPAAMSVTVTGPEIAAADAQLTAQTLLNIATGLDTLVQAGLLTPEAGARAAQKAWEDYMGIPFSADLNKSGGDALDALKGLAADENGGGGADVIPITAAQESVRDGEELHKYWTRGDGLGEWVDAPQPWYALHDHLAKYIHDEGKLAETTTRWYHDVFHRYPNSGSGHQRKGSR